MTAADYAAIRHSLDHPRVLAHDPCAPTLARADSAWPPPADHDAACALFASWPRAVFVRCAVVAAVPALRVFEDECPAEDAPRMALQHTMRWLCRPHEVDAERLRQVCEAACYAGESNRSRLAASAVGYTACAAYVRMTSDSPIFPSAPRAAADVVFVAARLKPPGGLAGWWARCRAAVPIADPACADIEWAGLELPPRPLSADLPGNGNGGGSM